YLNQPPKSYKRLSYEWKVAPFEGSMRAPRVNGFFAALYGKYEDNHNVPNQLVVAYRGTSNTPDFYVDGDLASGNFLAQGQDAIRFLSDVLNYAQSINIDHKDIYITGHSLGGGLAQWISMLTVDNHSKFTGLKHQTAFRTVTFNPPGMQMLVGKNADYFEYYKQEQIYSQQDIKEAQQYMQFYNADNTAEKTYTDPKVVAEIQEIIASEFSKSKLKHAEKVIKHYKREYGSTSKSSDIYSYENFQKLIQHQMMYKNRQDALRMGQETMVFLWDNLFNNEQGGECFQKISNCYPHIYNFSAKYDLVHCSGFPAGNIINYDIDKVGGVSAYWETEHLILASYFSARKHIEKYQSPAVHSAKTKLMCNKLAGCSDQSIDWAKIIERVVTKAVSPVSSMVFSTVKLEHTTLAAIYGGTAEHSMVNMLSSIKKNTDLADTPIRYDAMKTLIDLGKKSHIQLHTTERKQTIGQATQSNVIAYEQGYAKQTGGPTMPVYPYNQVNYKTF
ncbi:Mbeg1-like protein, partial [Piscirickettsia salmonis]|uniref:Mbeg1-like protein n=2 Tax=Piscirickettsia salmonis TaxID=1238 RepID=UPI003EB845DE